MTKNLTLFDTDNATVEAMLNQVFEDWIAHRQKAKAAHKKGPALVEKSVYVYREMWRAFARFCAERDLALPELSVGDLETFLMVRGTGTKTIAPRQTTKGMSLSARYANRYLVLIHRVTQFDANRNNEACNRAASTLRERPEYQYAEAGDKDPPPEYLNEVQAKVLIVYLTQAPKPESTEKMTWKTVRDRTAVALMLGAGLAPGDVRSLKLHGVVTAGGRKTGVPWKLALPGNGNAPARETPVADWAGRQLAFWLRIRAQISLPGEFVFPSTMNGTQWSAQRCFEACRDVLDDAKVANDAGGLFKLRHTFALRQLRKGKSEEDVAKWLGFLDATSIVRYRRIVTSFQYVV